MPNYADIVSTIVTDDLYTYALDNRNKTLTKLEYTGEIVDSYTFDSTAEFNNTSIHLTKDELIAIYDTSIPNIYVFNPTTLNLLSTLPVADLSGDNLAYDIYGNEVIGDWQSIAFDNNNYVYTIETNSLSGDFIDLGFTTDITDPLANNYHRGYKNIIYKYNLTTITEETSSAIYLGNYTRTPMVFTNANYEEIQFSKLFTNNASNFTLSKPFNPQNLLITKDNNLYVLNDTHELLKFEINLNKPVLFLEHVALFDNDIVTGSNFVDLTESVFNNAYDDYVKTPLWPSISGSEIATTCFNVTYEQTPNNSFAHYFWIMDSSTKALYKIDEAYEIVKCFSLPEAMDRLAYTGETYSSYSFTKPPVTTYDWHRKYDWLESNKLDYNFSTSIYTLSGNQPVKHTINATSPTLADKQWYHVAVTYNQDDGTIKLFLDNNLISSKTIESGQPIYNIYENGTSIGTNQLRTNSINQELNCDMYSFDGKVYDVRMYDYALSQSQLAQIVLSNLKVAPIEWNINVGTRQYIEQIERFFKNKTPGNASQFYKIRLSGLNINDTTLRTNIENIIRNSIEKVAPAYATLYEIEWQ